MLSKEKTIAIAVTTLALSLGGIGIAFAENSTPKSNVDVSYALPMTMSGNMDGFNMDSDMGDHMDSDMGDHMDSDIDGDIDGDMGDHMDEENSR